MRAASGMRASFLREPGRLLLVLGNQPLGDWSRIPQVLLAPQVVQVRAIQLDSTAELRAIADSPVARDYPIDRQLGEPVQARQVIADWVGLIKIEERDLDVRAHVARDQRSALREEHRAMPRRMSLMCDDDCPWPVPRDCFRWIQRAELAEEVQVMPGRRQPHSLDQVGALASRDGNGQRRGESRYVPKLSTP